MLVGDFEAGVWSLLKKFTIVVLFCAHIIYFIPVTALLCFTTASKEIISSCKYLCYMVLLETVLMKPSLLGVFLRRYCRKLMF